MTIARELKTRSRCRIDAACLLAAAVAGATSLPANAFAWSESVIYSFTGGSDGANPIAGLTLSGTTLYGAAFFGGANGQGTLFSIPTSGGTPTVLHAFNSTGDGAGPGGTPILDSSGTNLLGTTAFASINGSHVGSGNGTVYSYVPGTSVYTVLHTFAGGSSEGANPYAGLLYSQCSSSGTYQLYGTTSAGGASSAGTVFKLGSSTASAPLAWSYSLSGLGGQNAYGGLGCDTNSTLYGASVLGGGTSYRGLVYTISTGGGSPTAIYTFGSGTAYGGQSRSGLFVVDRYHQLGTTTVGGTYGKGVVYLIGNFGTGTYSYTTIYNFGTATNDGSAPWGTLIADSSGNLYGTTVAGGTSGNGTAFKCTKNSPTSYSCVTIYSFAGGTSDGANPYASLVFDGSGNLWGTTQNGGANGDGTIFKLTP